MKTVILFMSCLFEEVRKARGLGYQLWTIKEEEGRFDICIGGMIKKTHGLKLVKERTEEVREGRLI